MSSINVKRQSRSRSHSKEKKKRSSEYKDKPNFKIKDRRGSDEGVKLYLSNLGSNISERKIKEEFEKFGEVSDWSLKRKNGKGSNYFGYVTMKNKNAGELAMHHVNKHLGWKVTLYEKESRRESRNRDKSPSESPSKSKSRSRSRSRSRKNENVVEEEEEKKPSTTTSLEKPVQEEKRPEELRTVRVREIWVGNLPPGVTEQILYSTFFIYGEIVRIDLHSDKNYAFIRYKLCASASRAYEKAKNMNLGGSVIRVSFSDCGKRREIIGDEPGFELTEKTCKLLHASLNKNCQIANESIIRDIFKKYGTIKALHTKSSPGFRPSIYIEYSKPEEAEAAINAFTNDPNSEKRKLLGDPLCDINYYFKKKIYPVMNMDGTNMNNMSNMSNVNMSMNNNQAGTPPSNSQIPNPMTYNKQILYPYNNMMPIGNPMMMNNPAMYYQMIQRQQQMMMSSANEGNKQSINSMGQPPIPGQWNPGDPNNKPNAIPAMMPRFPFPYPVRPVMYPPPMFHNNIQNLNPSPTANPPQVSQGLPSQNPNVLLNPPPTTTASNPSNVKDILQEALSIIKKNPTDTHSDDSKKEDDLSSIRDESQTVFEKEYSLEEENLKNIWGGFLTKNKKDRVCVDAYQIRGESSDYLNNEYSLNVSHRTQFEEIMKRPILGIIAFSPQNLTQCEIFQDYINYFNEKQRVGVINLKSQITLYLTPPSEFSRKFYQNPKKHLLGILVNSSTEPKSYVDMNNLSLPPPVISSTEKKLVLKQQKRSQSVTTTSSCTTHGNNPNTSNISIPNSIDPSILNSLLNLDPNNLTEVSNLLNSNPQLRSLLTQYTQNNK